MKALTQKNLDATTRILFVDFSKAFDSIHRGKMEQTLLTYGLSKETVTDIMMLYKNTKYLFIICLDYVFRTSFDIMKYNGFKLAKERSRRFPALTITNADYADDIALLANTSAQAETLQHSLERAAGIDLHVNADKTEYTCFNQGGDIFSPNGSSLKLLDRFTYLGSSVSSTEKDINSRLAKSEIAID